MRKMYHFGPDQDDTLQERLADAQVARQLDHVEQQIRDNDLQDALQEAIDAAALHQDRERRR
ncbi:MAG TPA: hypothetical protein VKX46_05050 [Ktedonobacteraceae bacterium]|nr:hypothetical protein [Ktedonobacteraceae bacterium]